MKKLSIRVHKCHILRGGDYVDVNPRVVILVDSTYRFQTSMKRSTFDPSFEETFIVGNTHRRAVIEVSVYDSASTSILPGLVSGVVGLGQRPNRRRYSSLMRGVILPTAPVAAGSSGAGGGAVHDTDRSLLGRCYISIERLVQGEAKTRDYVLGSVGAPELPWLSTPEGVAGSITITLQSDVLGEPRDRFCLDSALEQTYTLRLKRLLLLYDKSQLQIIDLMIAHVRAIAEEAGSVAQKGTTSPNAEASRSEDLETIVVGGDPAKGVPGISFYRPKGPETFQQLMSRLCRQYGGMEPTTLRVEVCVYGCTNINREAFNTSVVGSDNVYAILRTENEDFTSSTSSLQETLVWTESNEVTLDVVNPSSFVLHVVVMGRSAARHYEIGRTTLSVATLALEHSSTRHMFLCSFESTLTPRTTGIVHVSLKPLNFGLTPLEIVKYVDNFYDRLGTFFKRYDPSRLPNIDALVHARLGELEEFMQDLVVEHGREPGSVRLLIAISEVVSLKEDATNELNDRTVQLVLSMGSTTIRTKSAKVSRFAPTKFSDSYCFDVVRETDIVSVEVIRRGDPSIVYGRVHFSCLNIQKGVSNPRTYYLVGESGTPRAFLSGIIRLSLFSDQVGHTYKVDTQTEALYTGRLRRYAYRRLPEALHRVNLAVATVFDMETFMAKLSQQYGDEDPTYAVYFTVLGCRQLKARFGGISPYVMVRVGVDAYYTKFVHDCKEPDFFEYCEFFFDRQSDTFITLIVMDHSGIGNDTEIGRVVISISDAQLGHQYHDFLPLQSPNPRGDVSEIGSVGFKYTVTDLNLVDRTRVQLIKKSHPCHKPHLRDDGRPTKRNTPEDVTDKRTRSGFLSKLNLWRRRAVAPMTLGAGARQTSNSNFSDVSLNNSSFDRLSDLVSDASIANGARPTSNLMDEGIMSMEEFCSVPTGGTKSVSNTESDNDLGELLNHSETIAQITGSVAQISEEGQMQLRVRALYCKLLYCTSKEKPNPYLLLSTMGETHRSRMEFNTINPNYNEEFTFKVTDPRTDFLRVTVLSDTPYGAKKLGHCVLCLQNVQRAEPHTRWVSLVVDSHSPSAFEHGSICLSLMGVNFGLDYLPSTEAENRLRERLRDFLVSVGGQHLHRLEWFVGEYSLHEYALPRLFGKAYVSQSVANSATLQITIGSVSKLMFEDARVDGNCVVKVRIAHRTRAKTRPVVGTNGYFRFDETFQLTVDNPATAVIRLGVTVNGREKAGVCYLSLADLHRGVAQERTHLLVAGPKTDDPFPAGLVTVSLLSGNYGSSSAPPTVEEETRFLRLQHYFYYYKRKELSMTDVRYSTTLNVNAYIRQLVDKWGPEPGNYRLHLTINGCNNLNLYSAATLNPFCLVRCGLDEYRTKIVHGRSDCVFNECFDLRIGLPDMEKVELILMNFSPAKSVEIGRTQVFLSNIRRDVVNSLRPLLVNHSSKSTGVTGGVDIELYTEDFGDGNLRTQSSTSLPYNSRNDTFSRVPSTLGITPSGTFQTHNALVATVAPHHSSGAENSEMSLPEGAPQGVVRAGAADIQLPVRVTFTSVRGRFPNTKEVYLRVTDGVKTLLYTKSTPLDELETMHATFEVPDVASIMDLVFTLKIGVHGFLGVSSAVCYADFCLNRCAPNKITRKTLRLYSVSGNFLGICTMDVDVPNVTFPNSNAIPPISSRMAESIKDDLASLVMKFSPLDLHHLDLAFRVGDAKGMHRSLRTQLAPDVIFTVYVVVREVRLDVAVKNTMCVSAVVGADYDEVPRRPAGEIFPYGMRFLEAQTGQFCPLRVDVATPSSEGLPLTLCVLDRSGKKKAVEVGRSVVSLRALLTPATFESSEQLTVPLVQVRYGANRAHATLVGSLTFSVAQPTFEGCPSLLRFPVKETANFDREYVRYYHWRINDLMKHYDANFLVDLHYKLYERFAATNTWREGLPKWLSELVTQWGPEMGPILPVPVLKD